MKLAPFLVSAFVLAWIGLASARGASVAWDGGGGDFSWQNRTNWSGDTLPGTDDDVTINVVGDATIVVSSNVTLRSLQYDRDLTLEAGTFKVTGGESTVQGRLVIKTNAILAATGAGTTLTAAGAVTADGAGFEVTSGARTSLPRLLTYSKGIPCRSTFWRANGAGSALEFPGLTALNGGACLPIEIEATGGAVVSLTNLATVSEGLVLFRADGTNSRVDLGSWHECLATQREVALEARNAGTIVMPHFSGGPMVKVTLTFGGALPATSLRRLNGFTVTGMAIDFSALTNLNVGSILVNAGSVVTLPALVRHDNGGGCQVNRWQASGAGSVLNLPALTQLSGSSCGVLEIQAQAGGAMILTNLIDLADGRLSFLADGVNSRVDLRSLQRSSSLSRDVTFEARNAGTMWIPGLPGGPMVRVKLASGGSLPVNQLTQLNGITVTGMSVEFPALTALTAGDLLVSGGGVLTLPNLASHNHQTGCAAHTWEVTGAGSVLNLPALTDLAGADCGVLSLEASAGGTIVVSNLSTIANGRLGFLADGTNSRIDLGALQLTLATNRNITFDARNNGTIWAPLWLGGPTVSVALQSGGVMPLAQIQSLQSLGVSGRGTDLALTEITNLFAGNLTVSGGAVLRLPNVTQHDHGRNCSVNLWEVSGPGSALDLTALTTLAGADCGELAIRALDGGLVDLSHLTTVADGRLSFLADGTNSRIALDTLGQSLATTRTVDFEARHRGAISMPAMPGGPTVNLTVRSNGVMSVAQLSQLGGITAIGSTLHLPSLTNFDDGTIVVSNAAVVTAPSLRSYAQRDDCFVDAWRVYGVGSVLDLSGLGQLSGAGCGLFDLQVMGGGQMHLSSLTNIPFGNFSVLSSGSGSVVDLSALATFLNPSGLSKLTATNGGVILLSPTPAILSGVALQLSAGTPGLPTTSLSASNLILHATSWRSYWVESRDTLRPDAPWEFFRRVPSTNEFQIIAPLAALNRTFRAREFVADPFALELASDGSAGVRVTLFGPVGGTFDLQATTNLLSPGAWPSLANVTMTNTFRIFPPEPLTTPQRFFRVRP